MLLFNGVELLPVVIIIVFWVEIIEIWVEVEYKFVVDSGDDDGVVVRVETEIIGVRTKGVIVWIVVVVDVNALVVDEDAVGMSDCEIAAKKYIHSIY